MRRFFNVINPTFGCAPKNQVITEETHLQHAYIIYLQIIIIIVVIIIYIIV